MEVRRMGGRGHETKKRGKGRKRGEVRGEGREE